MASDDAIFTEYVFGKDERAQMDRDGHFVLPGIMTPTAQEQMTRSLAHIEALIEAGEPGPPNHYAAENAPYLAELIPHPQMLDLAHRVLGADIRFDHCVSLNRPPGNGGVGWHGHEYADDDASLGFVRIFFYVNGFSTDDGGLKVVPGSHLYRDPKLGASTDDQLRDGWMHGKTHPLTGEPLRIESLNAPAGTVVLMWTHAAHAVTPRREDSDTRWTVVYAYRNPGRPSRARWITESFEEHPVPGAEGLMSLY